MYNNNNTGTYWQQQCWLWRLWRRNDNNNSNGSNGNNNDNNNKKGKNEDERRNKYSKHECDAFGFMIVSFVVAVLAVALFIKITARNGADHRSDTASHCSTGRSLHTVGPTHLTYWAGRAFWSSVWATVRLNAKRCGDPVFAVRTTQYNSMHSVCLRCCWLLSPVEFEFLFLFLARGYCCGWLWPVPTIHAWFGCSYLLADLLL